MSVRFIGNLPAPVQIGQVIVVTGRLRKLAKRFDINLASSKSLDGNVPLNVSWRHNENCIVRNTKNRIWSGGDRQQHRYNTPIDLGVICGEDFEILFDVLPEFFEISVNGKPYCIYHHRMAIHEISVLFVEHDVEFVRGASQRQISPKLYPSPRIWSINQNVNFSQDFPNPPTVGHVIVITGIPTGSAKGFFVIALHQSNAKQQALHLSTLFTDSAVVCNSRDMFGKFGDGERHGYFAFSLNQQFCIAIGFGNSGFHIAFDGYYYAEFGYRTNDVFSTVNALTITGRDGMLINVTGVDHIKASALNMSQCYKLSSPEESSLIKVI